MTATTESAEGDADLDIDEWRGVAAEHVDDMPQKVGLVLRERSRRLLGSLLRPYRRQLLTVCALIVVQTAAATAGPYLVSLGIDSGIPSLRHGDWTPVTLVTVAIVVSAFLDGFLRRRYLVIMGGVGQQALLELRRRVFVKFQRLSLAFHERYTSGRVISRLTNDFDALGDLLSSSLDGLVNGVMTVTVIGVLLMIMDWPLALVLVASFPALYALLRWFQTRSAVSYRRTRETVAVLIVQFVETMNGIRAVQAFRREPRNQRIFDRLDDDYRDANADAMRLLARFMPGVTVISGTVTAIVLVFGGYRVIHHDLQIGVLVAFLLYLREFFDPMQDLAMFFNSYQSANAALEKLSGVLEEPVDVAEPGHPAALPEPVRGEVTFSQVDFSYPRRQQQGEQRNDERVVLPELDLEIPAGQTVAIVGATGAGKSTLARLLCRFYDPVHGEILVDGVDVRRLADAELRRAVVMVTQENFLFTGTVADNIGFGRPGASRAEIEAAARAIGAHEFIAELPDGYDTDVRKRGGRLSAGQRQLVAFARAFLADPAVLVLDEATSSLDVPSERAVQRALRTILAERTALIIAHRLSTVEIADRVLVMEAGRIVEDGAPERLLTGGRFADLHAAWRDSLV